MAIGALTAARDFGVSVPEDLSLTGFDDISSVSDTVPPLTTVRIPLREIDRKAMNLALSPAPQIAHFSLDVIMRESVAVPRTTPRPRSYLPSGGADRKGGLTQRD
jgi:LacI family transcriptional regulator